MRWPRPNASLVPAVSLFVWQRCGADSADSRLIEFAVADRSGLEFRLYWTDGLPAGKAGCVGDLIALFTLHAHRNRPLASARCTARSRGSGRRSGGRAVLPATATSEFV